MGNKLTQFQKAPGLILGATTLTLLWLAGPLHAQTAAPQASQSETMPAQERQPIPADDITRRDLARFDQFLDIHHEIANQLRRTPSLIDDPQYLQSHPELNTYLQDHQSVKQEISERPDTFMRLEDAYGRDSNLRDRDARWEDRQGQDRSDRDADRRDMNAATNRDGDRREVSNFDRFLDGHREIAEQVRKDPSLLDNRNFVHDHPALESYLHDNPGVRDQLRQDPNAFMRQENFNDRDANMNRDANMRDRDFDGRDRDAARNNSMSLDRFLDSHREIAEQVRKDPSLLDNRNFVQGHPALQAYLQDNPGVRDQLRQDPNAFMHHENFNDHDANMRDRDPMHEHMADFGGFLGSHSDIQKDLQRDPSCVKNHDYLQHHAELSAYLDAHPDVRAQLMANPQNFVRGAQQYNNGTGTGAAAPAAGVNPRSTGTPGSTGVNVHGTPGSPTGTAPNPAATPKPPNQ